MLPLKFVPVTSEPSRREDHRVGAVSHGVEWLRSALSEISKDELRALAAVVWRHDPARTGSL